MTRVVAVRVLVPAALLMASVVPAALAEFDLEKRLELAPGGRLELEADSGRITIRGGSRDGVHVRITSSRDDVDERFRFTFDEDGDRVRIGAKKRGSSWFSWRGESLRFDLEVPTATALDLETAGGRIEVRRIEGEVLLHTSGGRIEVAEIHGDVDAHTSGGSISAEDIAGDLVVKTSGGSISVERVTGEVVAGTSGGSVRLEEIGGKARASSSGGSVSVHFAPGNGKGGSLSTSGGTVTAFVDPGVGLDIDASSSGGRVTVDLPVTVRGSLSRTAVRGTLNGGGPMLKLRSSGGGVRLKSN